MKKQKEKEWRETEFRKRVGEIDILELLKERNKNKKQIIDALDNEIKKSKKGVRSNDSSINIYYFYFSTNAIG